MTQTTQVVCDGCGKDLTRTGNCEDYRLGLFSESIPSRGGFVTAMAKYPAIDRNKHFCGIPCLDHWRDRERHFDKLMRAQSDAWKSERGDRDESGRIRSYPCPPDSVRDDWIAKSQAEADRLFPMTALSPDQEQ